MRRSRWLSKRAKFVLSALLLTVAVGGTQLVSVDWRYWVILLLGLVSYGLSAWALSDDLKGIEWLTLLVPPTLYTMAVSLFYFLLPDSWLSRLFVLGTYGLGMYAWHLTENIFSVAAMRTIQLLRAANAVGFLLTLVTGFFLWGTVFSFRWPFWVNGLLVGVISWALLVSGLWSVTLENKLNRMVRLGSLTGALVMGELGMGISLWPVSVAVASLMMVGGFYVILGLLQYYLQGRLFKNTINEYVGAGIVIWVVAWIASSWR